MNNQTITCFEILQCALMARGAPDVRSVVIVGIINRATSSMARVRTVVLQDTTLPYVIKVRYKIGFSVNLLFSLRSSAYAFIYFDMT
jgi:hypothetical protein